MNDLSITNELSLIIFQIDQFMFTFDNIHLAVLVVCILVFCETGLVVLPFLPGDSLLFVCGTLVAARNPELIVLVCLAIALAAILGNMTNYTVGRMAGNKIMNSRYQLVRPKHLEKTEHFYEKYGSKTLVISRFIPILRTIAPFMAGMGRMKYSAFVVYNLIGAVLWVLLFTMGGFFFVDIPLVRDNLTMVMILIIVASITPGIIALIHSRFRPDSPQHGNRGE